MRLYCLGIIGAGLLVVLAGCGPAVPPAELGHVIYRVPDIPQANSAYKLPPPPPAPPGAPKSRRAMHQAEFGPPPE